MTHVFTSNSLYLKEYSIKWSTTKCIFLFNAFPNNVQSLHIEIYISETILYERLHYYMHFVSCLPNKQAFNLIPCVPTVGNGKSCPQN